MIFASTKNKEIKMSYGEAIFQGLAEDGSLFHPVEKIDLKDLYYSFSSKDSFLKMASLITANLLKAEISTEEAFLICERAFTFEPKLKQLDEMFSVLELFHGPSAAFKDFGASFLASSMESFLKNRSSKAVILTATSGDTGSAVARAFYEKENIDVVILYPSNRVSPLQEKQLTTLGKNIHALEVLGSFDDCQRLVKEAFTDQALRKNYHLTSANSINVGRLIPQSFYYIWAWVHEREKRNNGELYFCVPSGNFGNLTAGLLANRWGMDLGGFIIATNRNKVVPEYLQTGEYHPRKSVQTPSNAMDVGAPSNFERMIQLYENHSAMKENLSAYFFDDETTLSEIKKYKEKYQYTICPHTAVGCLAAEAMLKETSTKAKVITLSTAHPGKFLEIVKEATEEEVDLPECLKVLINKEKFSVKMKPTLDDLRKKLKMIFQ